MPVDDTDVVQTYTGATRALFALPDDYRFRLARPTFPREEQLVAFWKFPDDDERELSEPEIEDDGEFLWCKPTSVAVWADSAVLSYRLTVYRRVSLLQQWDPSPNSPVDLPSQAKGIDRLTRAIQQIAQRLANTLGFHPQDTGGELTGREYPRAGLIIPGVAGRKMRAIAFDEDGEVSMVPLTQLSMRLSLAVATLDADAFGAIIDPSPAVTTVTILRGAEDETSDWALTADPSTGILGAWLDHDTYQVTGASQAGHVDIFATKAGNPVLTQRFFIAAIKQGYTGGEGESALAVSISGPQVFTYPKNSAVPSPSTPKTLTAYVQNITTGSVAWHYYIGDAWVVVVDEDGKVGGSTTLALTISHDAGIWSTNKLLRLRVTVTGPEGVAQDEFSLIKVLDGIDGYTVVLTNETHAVACDETGTPGAGELGSTGRAQSDVLVLKGAAYLNPVLTAPGPGEFRISVETEPGGDVVVLDSNTFYLETLSLSQGYAVILVELEGTAPANQIRKLFTWSKTLKGSKGDSPVGSLLTNDSQTCPANSDGSSPNLTNAVTDMLVYVGLVNDSANWSYAAAVSGVTGAFGSGATKNRYTVATFTADSGFVDITATRGGFPTQTKRFALAKAKFGQDSRIYWLTLTSPVIALKADMAFYPANLVGSSQSRIGSGAAASYAGRWKIYLNGSGSASYSSAADESSTSFAIPSGTTFVKFELYAAGGFVTLLDFQSAPVIQDGTAGSFPNDSAIEYYYDFNNDTKDRSGNGLAASVTGAVTYVTGRTGKALSTPGTASNYVSRSLGTSLDGYASGFTVALRASMAGTTGFALVIYASADSTKYLRLRRLSGFFNLTWHNSAGVVQTVATARVDDALEHEFAVQFDVAASTMRVYIDGVLVLTVASTSIYPGLNRLRFGRSEASTYYATTVEDFRIDSRVWIQDEVVGWVQQRGTWVPPVVLNETVSAQAPRYLGVATSDPSIANVGDRYYNSATKKLRKLQLSGWADDASSDGFMAAALDIYTLEAGAVTQAQAVQFIQKLVVTDLFASTLSALVIQFLDSVSSTRGGGAAPTIGDFLIYMGKDPRVTGTRPYEFALKEFVGTTGAQEEWIMHMLTKQMANGMLALMISGCVQAPSILSNPGRVWTQPSLTWSVNGDLTDADSNGNTSVVVAGLGNINRSTDSGATWGVVTHSHGTSHLLGVAASKEYPGTWAICGVGGKFSISTDNATSFGSLISTPFGASDIANVDAGNGFFVITGAAGKVAVYNILTGTFGSLLVTPLGTALVQFARFGNGVWFLAGAGGVACRSTNNLASFGSLISTPFGVNNIVDAGYSSGVWIASGLAGRLMRSEDGCQTWGSLISNPLSTAIATVLVTSTTTVAAGDGGRVITSKDLGKTWEEPGAAATYQPIGSGGSFTCGTVTSDGTFIVGGSFGGLFTGCVIRSKALDAGAGIVTKEVDSQGRPKVTFSEGTPAYVDTLNEVQDHRDTTGFANRTETVKALAIGQTANLLWVCRVTGGTGRVIAFTLPAGGSYEVFLSGDSSAVDILTSVGNAMDIMASFGTVAGGTSVGIAVASGTAYIFRGQVKRIS